MANDTPKDNDEKLTEDATNEQIINLNKKKPKCGIIMPISAMPEIYTTDHWADVLKILRDVTDDANFEGDLVSEADDINIIHKTIVNNIYYSDIVVCDVSGKNPNVMFELGMRLAFDKPTVIIKDDKTNYSFDTGVIEHLEYPYDLRFHKVIAFKEKLKKKITATYEKAQSDPNYSTFLKSFGEYKIAKLESKEISSNEFILQSLNHLTKDVREIKLLSINDKLDQSKSSDIISAEEMGLINKRFRDKADLPRVDVGIVGIDINFAVESSDQLREKTINKLEESFSEIGVQVRSTKSEDNTYLIFFRPTISKNIIEHIIKSKADELDLISWSYMSKIGEIRI